MQATAGEHNNYLEKIDCNDLKIGMYVQELDRPWIGTPFLFQGFRIRTEDEIHTISEYCEYVYINKSQEETVPGVFRTITPDTEPADSQIKAIAHAPIASSVYHDTMVVERELDTARTIYRDSHVAIEQIFRAVQTDGVINTDDARKTATGIVDSVLRNPDAFMLLSRIKNKGQYRYTHAINCCAITAAFCRHLGFNRDEIHDYSMGALLLDIGMTKLPASVIESHGPLNPLSIKLVRHHIDFGMEILSKTPDLPRTVHDMLLTHHERVSGKGYPDGLTAENIPVSGRIAAIIDCYDALVSNRPHKKGIPPTDAICSMYNWRNVDFHEELVEQFIQCIGAYPTGSLIELNSGQIGIIMSQNRTHRLFPRILLIMTADRVPYEKPHILDLWDHHKNTSGIELEISKVVDADELGIECSDYYL